MRFSVDAHAIGRHLTGNEVYVRNLLNSFAALDQTSEFIAYLSSDVMDNSGVVPDRFVRRAVSANALVRLGRDLSRRLREDRPNLLHVQYTAPLRCPVPVVVSVHDISFVEHPEYFTWPRATQLRITVPRTMERAVRVLTPSEFSRSAILREFNVSPDRVEVVPIAVSGMFRPIAREIAAAAVQRRYGITGPFVLTVGDLQPRKNQIGLIRAFEQLVKAYPKLPHQLVIAGKDTWYADRVHGAARASTVRERIRFTGWVTDEDLLNLYNACDLMAFPSLYEGFGLPVLEAMACCRAVACSNSSAIPEVADSAALLFDPNSIHDIVCALRDLLLNAELRARMERLGQARASLFTWERTARRTLEIYYEVAGATVPARAPSMPATR
jgi:glycosyltransferase involved in cell wall biosynthesis